MEKSPTDHSTGWYPTRLIDVGSPNSEREVVRLIETGITLPEGAYVTLSHCWGCPATVFKLESKNRESLLQQIPTLPTTFEDAIIATRKLGVRYIWIDCFCIIQDDRADWKRESTLIADIYRNARCNIAATASPDSNGGLLILEKVYFSLNEMRG